jgi:uncharacterized protein YqgC (DUF456 family)
MPLWINASIFAITLFFMLIGLVGLIIPIFPGLLIMWLAALGYGLISGFDTVGVILFCLITLLTILGTVIDNIMMAGGGRKGGAGWWSIGFGMIAGVIGTLLLPPVGGLIAAPGVILLSEYRRVRDWRKAWIATRSLAIGWGLSYFVRLAIGIFILIWWLVWAFLNR